MTLVKSEEFPTDFKRTTFPDFPKSEWKRRIEKVQGLMKEKDVDLLVLWMRQNCRYFSGFQTIHWLPDIHPVVDIIPAEGEPTLVVPALLKGNAEGICWEKDIRLQKDPHQLSSMRDLPIDVANTIKDLGYESATIGIEKGDIGYMWIPRPLNDIEAFMGELPDAEFVAADKIIWDCRKIKSSFEIERLRKAAQDLSRGLANVRENFRPGMTEADVQKLIFQEIELDNKRGDDTNVAGHVICGLSKEGMADIMALDGVTISSDSYLSLDILHYYKGYVVDRARTFQVGPVEKKIEEAHEAVNEGLRNAVDMLEPGVKANEIFEACYEPVVKAGYEQLDMAGHSIGMDCHEPPQIDAENETIIEENMVLSIEPWIWEPKKKGGVGLIGIQDNYVVTDEGCEPLCETPSIDKYMVAHPIK